MVDTLFYLCALGAVLTGIGVVVAKSPVMSTVNLLGSFACVAVIYLLMGFQFMAAIQILVYAGAVMVLFLFVVMLLNLGDLSRAQSFDPLYHQGRRMSGGIGIAAALAGALVIALLRTDFGPVDPGLAETGIDDLHTLAAVLFTRYALPLQGAAVLLMVTAVGVMVLAKRNRPGLPPAAGAELGQGGGHA